MMQSQSFYGGGLNAFNFDVSGTLGFSQSSSLGSLQGTDLNSPEVFKQNIQIAQEHIGRVQSLARSAQAGIEHAYHSETSPLQTAADLATLKQALAALVEHLRSTGVGALPLEPDSIPRAEEQLVAEAGRAVQALYERQKRMHDGVGVVAGLLAFQSGGESLTTGSQSQLSGGFGMNQSQGETGIARKS